MREILFSGKRVDNGEEVIGFYFNVPEHHNPDLSGKSIIISINNGLYFEVVPETVRQYTGLTDKNGTKIFEGDIVRYRPEYWSEPQCSVVEYCADKWNYPAFDLEDHYYEGNGLQCALEEGRCEVIGNIHDNPELLEEDKQ